MQRTIVWALVLFTAATAATAQIGSWLQAPMVAPVSGVILALVGAVLIGIAPQRSRVEELPLARAPVREV